MKTILVPVDFTETSNNALRYAVEWSKAYRYERIILLKTLYNSVFDSFVTSAEYMHVSSDYMQKEREEADEKLDSLCNDIIKPNAPDIKVSLAVSEEPLLRSVVEVIENEKVELIVVGSDNYSYSSDSFIGGHIIEIARISSVRVLVVPSVYQYQPVTQALVPCDFNSVASLNKLESYQTASPQWRTGKKLLVLNVDPKERYLHPDAKFTEAEKALHKYLKNFDHEVFYSNDNNIINAIIEFAGTHDVQIIIAMPGKHSFLFSLTNNSISEAIYRNAKKPVMILK